MGSQKRGEVGCLAENTGTSTLSWLGRIFLGSLWISNWTTLDPDHLSETAIAKILFGHQFAKDNPQWKFARRLSYWQFAELLTRTLICKIIDNKINLQMCCPELQFAKMLSGTAICKHVMLDETSQNVVQNKKLQILWKHMIRNQFASILFRTTICGDVFWSNKLQKCCL